MGAVQVGWPEELGRPVVECRCRQKVLIGACGFEPAQLIGDVGEQPPDAELLEGTNVTGQAVSFTGKATKVPQIGTKYAVWGGSHQLAMPVKKSPDRCKDAAWGIFVKYILDNSINWAKAGQIPANNRVRNSAEFKAIEPQASIAPSVEAVFFPPSVPGITDAFAPLDEAIGAVMTGKTTDIKGELDRAAEKANQILAENKQKYGTAPK